MTLVLNLKSLDDIVKEMKALKIDKIWFFHPIACWLTLWEYGWGRIGGIFNAKELRREGWRQ